MIQTSGILCVTKLNRIIVQLSIFKKLIKLESTDQAFLRNFVPRHFDISVFSPSLGALGGIVTIWNSSFYSPELIDCQPFSIVIVEFTSSHKMEKWKLVNIYGPTREPDRTNFVAWLYSLNIDSANLSGC